MSADQRRIKILELIQEKGRVEVASLAKMFKVSNMTIRRDLNLFEKQGLITTNYGGARLAINTQLDLSFNVKKTKKLTEKDAIGKRAAEHVKDGMTIAIDCGSTAMQLAKYIQDKNLTVITNSIPVVNMLANCSKIQLLVACGIYNEFSAGMRGALTIDFYENYSIDLAFLSTEGLTVNEGVSLPDIDDAMTKKAIMKASKKSILLADSSKFGNSCMTKYADLKDFEVIITDSKLGEAEQIKLRENSIDYEMA